MKKNSIKFAKDSVLNIVASMMVTFTLQIVVYPFLAQKMGDEKYGEILTVMAVFNTLISTLGNTVNNARLIRNAENEREKAEGDFNVITIVMALLGALITGILAVTIYNMPAKENVFLLLAVIIGIVRAYYIVTFRIWLDFKKQIVSNMLAVLGYVLGIFLVSKIELWPIIFLCGELASLVYVLCVSTLPKAGWKITGKLNQTLVLLLQLIIISLLANVLTYFDRFLINPLLGAKQVAIFTVAAFWGRSLSAVFEPIANVILGYCSQKDFEITRKKFNLIFGGSCIVVFFFWGIGFAIAPFLTRVLYPSIINDALPYISIVSLACLMASISTFLRPILLVMCKKNVLIGIQVIYIVIYALASVCFIKSLGLYGMGIAIFIANLCNSILYVALGNWKISHALSRN